MHILYRKNTLVNYNLSNSKKECNFEARKKETKAFRFFHKRLKLGKKERFAQMVELVDTLVSGTSGRKAVQVRVLFWALNI